MLVLVLLSRDAEIQCGRSSSSGSLTTGRNPLLESDTDRSLKFHPKMDGRGKFDGLPAVKKFDEFLYVSELNLK